MLASRKLGLRSSIPGSPLGPREGDQHEHTLPMSRDREISWDIFHPWVLENVTPQTWGQCSDQNKLLQFLPSLQGVQWDWTKVVFRAYIMTALSKSPALPLRCASILLGPLQQYWVTTPCALFWQSGKLNLKILWQTDTSRSLVRQIPSMAWLSGRGLVASSYGLSQSLLM